MEYKFQNKSFSMDVFILLKFFFSLEKQTLHSVKHLTAQWTTGVKVLIIDFVSSKYTLETFLKHSSSHLKNVPITQRSFYGFRIQGTDKKCPI